MRHGLGTAKTAKQTYKQTSRQVEFSDAFKKILVGGCPVQAAMTFTLIFTGDIYK